MLKLVQHQQYTQQYIINSSGILKITNGTITNTTGYYAVYNERGDVSGVVGGTISSKNF